MLFNADKTALLQYPMGKKETAYSVPNGVTVICQSAFFSCSNLVSVDIPEGVTAIGQSAFSGCSSLMSVDIPKSVTAIATWAFESTGIYENEENWKKMPPSKPFFHPARKIRACCLKIKDFSGNSPYQNGSTPQRVKPLLLFTSKNIPSETRAAETATARASSTRATRPAHL